MTNTPTDFEAALEAKLDSANDKAINDSYMCSPHSETLCISVNAAADAFEEGARWSRAWVLANDPVVRAMQERIKELEDELRRVASNSGR